MALLDKTKDKDFDICWARGDTKPRVFTVQDSAGTTVDVSGSTFRMRVNTEKNPTIASPGTILFTATGAFVTDGTDGRIEFAPTPSTWADALSVSGLPTKVFYDIEETDGNGDIETLIKGVVKIEEDIAK